jgi:hypothetical protein
MQTYGKNTRAKTVFELHITSSSVKEIYAEGKHRWYAALSNKIPFFCYIIARAPSDSSDPASIFSMAVS